MSLPAAIVKDDSFALALEPSTEQSASAQAARRIMDLNGSHRAKTLDMQGMGTQSKINDTELMSLIGQSRVLLFETGHSENASQNDPEIEASQPVDGPENGVLQDSDGADLERMDLILLETFGAEILSVKPLAMAAMEMVENNAFTGAPELEEAILNIIDDMGDLMKLAELAKDHPEHAAIVVHLEALSASIMDQMEALSHDFPVVSHNFSLASLETMQDMMSPFLPEMPEMAARLSDLQTDLVTLAVTLDSLEQMQQVISNVLEDPQALEELGDADITSLEAQLEEIEALKEAVLAGDYDLAQQITLLQEGLQEFAQRVEVGSIYVQGENPIFDKIAAEIKTIWAGYEGRARDVQAAAISQDIHNSAVSPLGAITVTAREVSSEAPLLASALLAFPARIQTPVTAPAQAVNTAFAGGLKQAVKKAPNASIAVRGVVSSVAKGLSTPSAPKSQRKKVTLTAPENENNRPVPVTEGPLREPVVTQPQYTPPHSVDTSPPPLIPIDPIDTGAAAKTPEGSPIVTVVPFLKPVDQIIGPKGDNGAEPSEKPSEKPKKPETQDPKDAPEIPEQKGGACPKGGGTCTCMTPERKSVVKRFVELVQRSVDRRLERTISKNKAREDHDSKALEKIINKYTGDKPDGSPDSSLHPDDCPDCKPDFNKAKTPPILKPDAERVVEADTYGAKVKAEKIDLNLPFPGQK